MNSTLRIAAVIQVLKDLLNDGLISNGVPGGAFGTKYRLTAAYKISIGPCRDSG